MASEVSWFLEDFLRSASDEESVEVIAQGPTHSALEQYELKVVESFTFYGGHKARGLVHNVKALIRDGGYEALDLDGDGKASFVPHCFFDDGEPDLALCLGVGHSSQVTRFPDQPYARDLQLQTTGGKRRFLIMDSGVDRGSPMLRGQHVGGDKDALGHGTAVASIILGAPTESPHGILHGVAPDAAATVLRVLDEHGSGKPSDVLRAWDRVEGKYLALGMSFGREGECGGACAVCRATTMALDQGIVKYALASSGNKGPGRLACPGSSPRILGVGSRRVDVDFMPQGMTLSEAEVSGFTGTGTTQKGVVKPDLYAPGGSGSGTAEQWIVTGTTGLMAKKRGALAPLRGTSFSVPHLLGYLALLDEAGLKPRPRGA